MTIDADLLAYYAEVAKAFPALPADADPLAIRRQFQNVAREFAAPRPAGVERLRKCILKRMQRIASSTSIALLKFERWTERLRDGFLR